MQYPEGTANDWCQVQDLNLILRINRRSSPMSYLGMASKYRNLDLDGKKI